MTRTSRHPRAAAAVLLAVVAALAASPVFASEGVATLGSPPPDDDQATEAMPAADPMDAMLDYAACMRDHGVDMPDPQAGAGGGFVIEIEATGDGDVSMGSLGDMLGEEFVAADEACSGLLGAMTSERDPEFEAEIIEAMLAHADCMREHGIDMPDPVMNDGMIAMGMVDLDNAGGPDIDFFSDEYVAAEEACRDVLPFGDEGTGFTDLSTP